MTGFHIQNTSVYKISIPYLFWKVQNPNGVSRKGLLHFLEKFGSFHGLPYRKSVRVIGAGDEASIPNIHPVYGVSDTDNITLTGVVQYIIRISPFWNSKRVTPHERHSPKARERVQKNKRNTDSQTQPTMPTYPLENGIFGEGYVGIKQYAENSYIGLGQDMPCHEKEKRYPDWRKS